MSALYDIFRKYPRISTDTRRIEPESLFFALRGTTFDGNRFAAEALEKGAVHAVVDDPSVAIDERFILVDDTLLALQELAQEHRRTLGIPILVVAGSNGKTTTKELVSRVLAKQFEVYATKGNLNNHIGVPLTLLAMTPDTQFGVVEIGASACGEIARLSEIAEPDYGILTNIGHSHLEGFGGPEGVRRGKGELYDFLASHNGHAFVRAEDMTLCEMIQERPSLARTYYPTSLADNIESHLAGDYNRYNIAVAVAVGEHFGVAEEQIRQAIAAYIPDNNRSQRHETARNTLIVDCYNANPSSMQASVGDFLSEPLHGRHQRIMILGDMLELGRWSQEEHGRILQLVGHADNLDLWLVGSEFTEAYHTLSDKLRASRVVCFTSCAELLEALKQHPVSDALILIKGSHSIGLERTIALL